MATLKLGFLPRIKAVSEDHDADACLARQLRFPVTQEAFFVQLLSLERSRTERSGRPFMLVLIGAEELSRQVREPSLQRIAAAIRATMRETDVLGWYKQDTTLGLLMTEIAVADMATIDLLTEKVASTLRRAVGEETSYRIQLNFRLFSGSLSTDAVDNNSDSLLYPDLAGLC
jgi:hypothetical protein